MYISQLTHRFSSVVKYKLSIASSYIFHIWTLSPINYVCYTWNWYIHLIKQNTNLFKHTLSEIWCLLVDFTQIQFLNGSTCLNWAFKLTFFIWLLWRPFTLSIDTSQANLVTAFQHNRRRIIVKKTHDNFAFKTFLVIFYFTFWFIDLSLIFEYYIKILNPL